MALISIVTGIVIGICLYAGTHFLLTFFRVRKYYMADKRYLLFCAMCYMAITVLGCELVAYQTQDVDFYVELFRWRAFAASVFLVIWAWFVFIYTRAGHKVIPLLFSAGFGLFFLINLISSHGDIFDQRPTLKTLTLPWGETVSMANFSMNTSGYITWVLILSLFLYTLYAAFRQFQRGQRHESVFMFIGTLIFIGFTVQNYFVRAGHIDFIFLAGYGFPSLLIIMGMSLHRDALEVIERLHAVTDFVPAAVHIKDTRGRYLMANREFEKKYHLRQEDILRKTDFDIRDRMTAQRNMQLDERVLQNRQAVEFNEISKDAQGNDQYFQTFNYPLYDSDGELFALCGISIDITESRRAQSLLGNTESKYRILFENANDAILILKNGEFIDCNQRACTMFNCRREDMIGRSPAEFSPEVQPGGQYTTRLAMEKIGAAIAGVPQLFDWQHRRLDGSLFDAEVNLNRLELDGVIYVQGLVRDVSERKQAERDLSRQRELLETSVNATPGGYFMFNTKGVVIYSNRTFQKVVDMSPVELASINIIDYFVHPDDLHLAYKAIEKTVRSGTTVNEQLRILAKGDKIKTLLVTVTRFNIDDEAYLVAAAIDISGRVAAEAELNTYRERLEELVASRTTALESANQELESFSYSVSHDLRAPLRTINGFSRALMEEYGEVLGEEGQSHLARVMASSVRMGNLIDDILKLSRINRTTLNFTAVNMSAMAGQVVRQLKADSKDRQVKMTIMPDMTVTGDTRLLEIMLGNLLDNAWKYTSKKAYAEIEFGQIEDDGATVFYVRDNGAGFDMRYADNLFGAFQRLHGDEFPGTGIGLATVARVIHRHGGHVWAEATPGQGATFYFKLNPAVSDEQLARNVISHIAGGSH